MEMSQAASDSAKERVPGGTRRVAAGVLFAAESGFVKSFGQAEGWVAQEDGAAVDGVDSFTLAKGETGGFADGADFSAVWIVAPGAVGKVFEKEETVLAFDRLKGGDVDGVAKGVLKDESVETFILLAFLGERRGGVIRRAGGEVDKDWSELGAADGFDYGMASKGV